MVIWNSFFINIFGCSNLDVFIIVIIPISPFKNLSNFNWTPTISTCVTYISDNWLSPGPVHHWQLQKTSLLQLPSVRFSKIFKNSLSRILLLSFLSLANCNGSQFNLVFIWRPIGSSVWLALCKLLPSQSVGFFILKVVNWCVWVFFQLVKG